MTDAKVTINLMLSGQEPIATQEFPSIQDAIAWLEKLRALLAAAKTE